MKKIILLFGLSLISISCSKDDSSESPKELPLTKINIPLNLKYSLLENDNYIETFEYDNLKNVTLRNGGFIKVNEALGIYPSYLFSNNLIQELKYEIPYYGGVDVIVRTYTKDNEEIMPRIKFYLNKEKKITSKIIIYRDNYGNIVSSSSKKQEYTYLGNKISNIKTSFPYQLQAGIKDIKTETELFYYDLNDNLINTEHKKYINGEIYGEITVQLFENYDNSPNPFKILHYIDDYFYRSLSKNNFRKYTKKVYTNDGKTLLSDEQMNWNPTYDSKGNIILYIEK